MLEHMKDKLEIIKDLYDTLKAGDMSERTFIRIIDSIFYPPVFNYEDVEWAEKILHRIGWRYKWE